MALNKFIHPRNIYKTPPDFTKLANTYEEFAKIVKKDVTGKINLDFKDPQSLRILTQCLLKSDFNLEVDIPVDRLVPTLPLRLNYILWIEDLLNVIEKPDEVWGLDIGTGACAIYPLLAAEKNKWHMIGTENDEQSLLKAQENVLKNNLQNLIEINRNTTETVINLKNILSGKDIKFCFSMCNPPFYSNMQELYDSRSPARVPPKNGFTGSPHELITDGGELSFCRKMINESKEGPDNVLLYTTMVGHKYNMKLLEEDLKSDGINYTTTEFCQGRVTRWGLAWTFQLYDLATLLPGRSKPRKKSLPVAYLLPEIPGTNYDVDDMGKIILKMLQELNIQYKIISKRKNIITLNVKAFTNTWTNQRRKRRLEKRQAEVNTKKVKINDEHGIIDEVPAASDHKSLSSQNHSDLPNVSNPSNETIVEVPVNSTQACNKTIDGSGDERQQTSDTGIELNDTKSSGCEEIDTSTESEPILQAILKMFKKDDNITLEMEFLDGNAGKEGLHQIVQYIKNKLK